MWSDVRFPMMFLTINIVGEDGHAYTSYCELSCLSSHIHIGVCKFSLAAVEHENWTVALEDVQE